MTTDSPAYLEKKRQLARVLTIYGRKPVLEALQDGSIRAERLHLAETNQAGGVLDDILHLAKQKQVETLYHSREALARISKNRKQDQGIALDIQCAGFQNLEDFTQTLPKQFHLLALDNVTNPQNVGMIIRSVCASPATGLILPNKGCAKLDSLVIKASAGTLFKARILRCDSLAKGLQALAQNGAKIYGLEANAKETLSHFTPPEKAVYVLGNETSGLSAEVKKVCNASLAIPMCNGVESLNVSVAASLIAFAPSFAR